VKRRQRFLTLPVRLSLLLANQIDPINKINKINQIDQIGQTDQRNQMGEKQVVLEPTSPKWMGDT